MASDTSSLALACVSLTSFACDSSTGLSLIVSGLLAGDEDTK
ncbi:MAG: hypothetical protein AAF900_00600 [Bacteroidota bacterium]